MITNLDNGNDGDTAMIDLHTHTLFSDGELVPAELARRADRLGYRWLAITDHVDSSTL
jgi:histidinol phosphatase-like PHP family hydrolase